MTTLTCSLCEMKFWDAIMGPLQSVHLLSLTSAVSPDIGRNQEWVHADQYLDR